MRKGSRRHVTLA